MGSNFSFPHVDNHSDKGSLLCSDPAHSITQTHSNKEIPNQKNCSSQEKNIFHPFEKTDHLGHQKTNIL